MDIAIVRRSFVKALTPMLGVIDHKGSVPIMAHLLFEPEPGAVVVQGTDLEVGLKVRIECAVDESRPAGAFAGFTLPAQKLLQILKEVVDESVTFKTAGEDQMEIRAGRSRFKVMGLDPRSFPAMPGKEPGTHLATLKLRAGVLSEILESTVFAVNEARYNLSGVYIESPEAGRVRCVATDGHRLALIDREAPGFELTRGQIVPRKAIVAMRSLLDESPDAAVELNISENCVTLALGQWSFSTRLIEGEFPDYRGVLPKDFKYEVEFSRDALIAAIKRVSIMSNERYHGVKLVKDDQLLTVSSTSPDSGEAEDSLDISSVSGTIEAGFNAQYLLQGLAILPKETNATLRLTDETGPGLITSAVDPDFRYVVMPMRL